MEEEDMETPFIGALRETEPADAVVEIAQLATHEGRAIEYRQGRSTPVRVCGDTVTIGGLRTDRAGLRELAALARCWRDERVAWAAYEGAGARVGVWVNVLQYQPLVVLAPGTWRRRALNEDDPKLADHLAARKHTVIVPARSRRRGRWQVVASIVTGLDEPFGEVVRLRGGLYGLLARRAVVVTALPPERLGKVLRILTNGRHGGQLASYVLDAPAPADCAVVDLLVARSIEAAVEDVRSGGRG